MSYNKILPLLNKIQQLSKESDQKYYSEIFEIAKKHNFPNYSISLLINNKLNKVKGSIQTNLEGWITNESTIPKSLINKIKDVCKTGEISLLDREDIYSEAAKLKIDRNKINEFINSELKSNKKEETPKKKKTWLYMLIGIILILSVIGIYSYNTYYLPYKKDKDADRKIIIANTYKLRSTKYLADNDANVITTFPYGHEVIVYSEDSEWAEVKVIDKYSNVEYTGFMGKPMDYLCDKVEFYEVDGIYGNEDARKLITGSYAKKAILNYIKDSNWMTDIPEDIQIELYGRIRNKPIWQLYGLSEDYTYNTVTNGKLLGSDDWCLVVIIAEKSNLKNRELLIFRFDEENIYQGLMYSENIGDDFDGVRIVRKNNKYHIGETYRGESIKSELEYDAIELGNNNINLKRTAIIVYNGITFKKYYQ